MRKNGHPGKTLAFCLVLAVAMNLLTPLSVIGSETYVSGPGTDDCETTKETVQHQWQRHDDEVPWPVVQAGLDRIHAGCLHAADPAVPAAEAAPADDPSGPVAGITSMGGGCTGDVETRHEWYHERFTIEIGDQTFHVGVGPGNARGNFLIQAGQWSGTIDSPVDHMQIDVVDNRLEMHWTFLGRPMIQNGQNHDMGVVCRDGALQIVALWQLPRAHMQGAPGVRLSASGFLCASDGPLDEIPQTVEDGTCRERAGKMFGG